jgi:DNA-binding XRE family transcriptional regulator
VYFPQLLPRTSPMMRHPRPHCNPPPGRGAVGWGGDLGHVDVDPVVDIASERRVPPGIRHRAAVRGSVDVASHIESGFMPGWSALAELSNPGDSIRERRIELGWTQAELSNRSGVPQADISRIENGRLDTRLSTIRRIAIALADANDRPLRSLANGHKVPEVPAPQSPKWSAKGATIEITRPKN